MFMFIVFVARFVVVFVVCFARCLCAIMSVVFMFVFVLMMSYIAHGFVAPEIGADARPRFDTGSEGPAHGRRDIVRNRVRPRRPRGAGLRRLCEQNKCSNWGVHGREEKGDH